MPLFKSNDVSISYHVEGKGKPVILLHGGAVDFNYNYVQTGWVNTLTDNGYQVIGIDYRGYGKSDKSTDPTFYGTTNISNDVINLIQHLKLETVALIGYSMGTLIALDLLHKHPENFSSAVLMATGDGLIGQPPLILEKIIPGMAEVFAHETFPSHLPSHISAYWNFVTELGLDKAALTAFSLAEYPTLSPEEVSTIEIPTLIISGENDLVLGQGINTAKKLINGRYLEIKNANHFTLATEKSVHQAVIEFLNVH